MAALQGERGGRERRRVLQQQPDGKWAGARVVEARRERSKEGVLALVECRKGAYPATGVSWEDTVSHGH